jgi:pilus assembly protein Flp/PilA
MQCNVVHQRHSVRFNHCCRPYVTYQEEELIMNRFLQAVKRFVKNEDGPTAVEYAVMLALIIVLCIVVIRQVGTSASQAFSVTDSAIS